MKKIYIDDNAKLALERHAMGGCLMPGSYKAIASDTWEIKLPDDLYERLQKIQQKLRDDGISATFSDVVITLVETYGSRPDDKS